MSYIPSRYTLIPEQLNITVSNTLTELVRSNTSVSKGSLANSYSSVLSISPETSYLIIALVIILIISLIILIINPSSIPSPRKSSIIGIKQESFSREPSITYVYEGFKRILRNIYIELRRRHRCYFCTPRELSMERSDEEIDLGRFAEIYERIVYGDKEPRENDKSSIERWVKCLENH